MSLKAIHLVFIAASTLLAFGFGGWSLKNYFDAGGTLDLIYGIVSLSSGVALVFYGKYFLKKLKHISYL